MLQRDIRQTCEQSRAECFGRISSRLRWCERLTDVYRIDWQSRFIAVGCNRQSKHQARKVFPKDVWHLQCTRWEGLAWLLESVRFCH